MQLVHDALNIIGLPLALHVVLHTYIPNPTAREIASLATMKLNYGGALNISLEPVESEDVMEDVLVYDSSSRRCLGAAGML